MERRQTEIDSLLSQGRMNKQAQGREGEGRDEGKRGSGGGMRSKKRVRDGGREGGRGGRVRLPVIKP